jgi:small subunit ribosomal protein S15
MPVLNMARIHARRKGKSGSTKPLSKNPPNWISYKSKEVEALVLKLAKQGNSTSKIGLILRDSYGIPDVKHLTKKSISDILKAKKMTHTVPEDLQNLIRKTITLRKHLEKNKKDLVSKRGLKLTESKILRLIKYYKRTGVLSESWKYSPDKASLLIS